MYTAQFTRLGFPVMIPTDVSTITPPTTNTTDESLTSTAAPTGLDTQTDMPDKISVPSAG